MEWCARIVIKQNDSPEKSGGFFISIAIAFKICYYNFVISIAKNSGSSVLIPRRGLVRIQNATILITFLFPTLAVSNSGCYQGLIANNKTAFFGRQFFVSSDINPLRDLRYTAMRCDISSMRYALRGAGDLYHIAAAKQLYRICRQANISRPQSGHIAKIKKTK